jgi:Vps53-like, N-terminal
VFVAFVILFFFIFFYGYFYFVYFFFYYYYLFLFISIFILFLYIFFYIVIRTKFIAWLVKEQLFDYKQSFRLDTSAAQLDSVERRYVWLKRELQYLDESYLFSFLLLQSSFLLSSFLHAIYTLSSINLLSISFYLLYLSLISISYPPISCFYLLLPIFYLYPLSFISYFQIRK